MEVNVVSGALPFIVQDIKQITENKLHPSVLIKLPIVMTKLETEEQHISNVDLTGSKRESGILKRGTTT